MSFPPGLDFDRVMLELLNGVACALKGWKNGGLLTEEPLMNRLIEPFNRNRRGCDVGVVQPITMTSTVALLHRRGERQRDAFGSDLAITVDVPSLCFRKTSLLQLKVADEMTVTLERDQIEAAHVNELTVNRSIVLAIDRDRLRGRVAPTKEVLKWFTPDARSATRSCADWQTLGQWASKWLSCEVGVASEYGPAGGVEGLLQQFVVEAPSDWRAPWDTANNVDPSGGEWRPAKAWLVMRFEPSENKELGR